jgi:effector-binding domain-containing protein
MIVSAPVVRLDRHAAVPLAVVRRQAHPSELSRVVPECCGLVWNVLKAQGVKGGRHVAVYYDDAIRLEVGAEVTVPFAEREGVVRSSTPAGTVACVTHFGPYGGLSAAHDAIHTWCKTANHRLAGPRWEIYGHWQSAWDTDPSRIRTDVCYLIGTLIGT